MCMECITLPRIQGSKMVLAFSSDITSQKRTGCTVIHGIKVFGYIMRCVMSKGCYPSGSGYPVSRNRIPLVQQIAENTLSWFLRSFRLEPPQTFTYWEEKCRSEAFISFNCLSVAFLNESKHMAGTASLYLLFLESGMNLKFHLSEMATTCSLTFFSLHLEVVPMYHPHCSLG